MADVYTHGHDASVLANHRHRTAQNSAPHLLPHLRPGLDLLDVGCGVGTITADLAGLVAPGTLHAIDVSEEVLDEARAVADERGVRVEFSSQSVYDLCFDDNRFDVVHAHQVLQHLTDPVAALREMGRVCRPGGIVAVRDADYAAMAWYPDEPGMEEWRSLYRLLARENGAQPDAGRRLLSWVHAAGFGDVQPSAGVWVFATPAERGWWGGLWAERISGTAIAHQALDRGHAIQDDLDRMAEAWRRWAAHPDAWFTVVHGEMICRVRGGD